MRKDPSEVMSDHVRRVEASNNPKCTLLKPVDVRFEYVKDYVVHGDYWVTCAEEIGDAYGTGYTEDAALKDLFEAITEMIEWYEEETTDLNDYLKADYHQLLEYVSLTKKR